MFDPKVGQKIKINSRVFSFVEHPFARGIPFGQEGRSATVYKVVNANNRNEYALKIYNPNYRFATKLTQVKKMAEFSSLPGLAACAQEVIEGNKNPELINDYPDLEFAILMPWIDGETWYELFQDKSSFSISRSRTIAQNFAEILCNLERRGVAHCDLSASNTIINLNALKENKPIVSLIDFDDFFVPGFPKPKILPRGTSGYNHITQRSAGTWEERGDRFAGAILLTEMLIFHDDRAKYSSDGDSYFAGDELQLSKTNRFPLAVQVLREQGDTLAAELLEKAWLSKSLNDCPKLCEWFQALTHPISTPIELVKNINKRPTLEAKCTIVGQGSVGKTSLVQQIVHNTFDEKQSKTEGISINLWRVGVNFETYTLEGRFYDRISDDPIRLNIWDFGGQEIMHATHQFFLSKRSLYLLVLDSRLTQEENRVEYWLKIIQSFGGESPILIVGNKTDQHPLDIDRTGLQKKYPNIVGILETSAATGAGIEELKAAITEQVNHLPHVRDLLPETWFTVKTKLEELGRQSNFITQEKYLDLCAENEVSDETSQRTLIGFLHDLGVVLHFQDDPRLEALGILNPQWVTNGVYKILNSHALFQNKGILTTSMLDEILNLPEYPRGKRLFIVDMMKKFELCWDINPDKTFLVPDLLPKDQPDLKFNGVPAFEYAYPVLPSSVITRFIVRMNQKIDDGFVWRTGVVLKIGENKALVKADIEDRKIAIAIEGLEHTRRDALSAIRYQLDEIHNSIKGLSPEKFVPIPGAESQRYEFLLQLEHDGVKILPVPGKGGGKPIMLDISQLLSGIESEAQRRENVTNVTTIYQVNTGGGDFTGRDKSISAGDSSVVVGGNMFGNLISGNYNKINSAEIDPELKDTLLQLGEAVNAMLQKLPAEQAAEVAEDFGKLADEAVKPKPNKRWYSVSIDGLIKAAENLDKLGTPVISLSRKVLSLLTGGVIE